MKRVIIQGDDWGMSIAASAGIAHAYEYGVMTQTVVMANLLDPARKEEYRNRIDRLVNRSGLAKGKLGIGVHLNVTCGKPLSPKWNLSEVPVYAGNFTFDPVSCKNLQAKGDGAAD